MNSTTRVALYLRTARPTPLEGFGLEDQKARLLDYLEHRRAQGWRTSPRWTFTDVGSGAHTDRPGLRQLLQAAEARAFDVLLVCRANRLSRSLTDLLKLVEHLTENDIRIVSIQDNLPLSDLAC